jgi:membrane carboxypeptidase/penicillin-binding protein
VWVGYDQPKTIGADAYGSRYAAPIWSDFMRRAARLRAPGEFDAPAGLKEATLCRVSYLRPVEGCPTYTEYFKPDDAVPGKLCTVHQGTIRQQVRRAIEGVFSGLGRRIRGIFR